MLQVHHIFNFCILFLFKVGFVDIENVRECVGQPDEKVWEEVPIQIITKESTKDVEVYRCHIRRKRTGFHCGMHSHTSGYQELEVLTLKVSPEECKNIIDQ